MSVDYLQLLSPDEVRAAHLAGFPGSSLIDNSVIETNISRAGDAWFTYTGVAIGNHVVKTFPDEGLVKGVDFDREGKRLTWRCGRAVGTHRRVVLPNNNLQSIERIRGIRGNQVVVLYPDSWIIPNLSSGSFQIVASPGDNVVFYALSGVTMLSSYTALWGYSNLPGYWAVDYTHGIPFNEVAMDVKGWISTAAATYSLIANPRGIVQSGSISMDGISKSASGKDPMDILLAGLPGETLQKSAMMIAKSRYTGIKLF